MKDTFAKRVYKCKCGQTQDSYAWQSELNKHKFKCNKCGINVTFKELNVKQYVTSIRTPTKNR